MFWLDDALCSDLYLDGIVTVVDSKFCSKQISKENKRSGTNFEFCNQIALADVILLNKIDLVDDHVLRDSLKHIQQINSSAHIHQTTYGKLKLNKLLDLHAYDTGSLASFPYQENASNQHLDSSITTCTFQFEGMMEEKDLDFVLEELLWSNDEEDGPLQQKILRLKAVVSLAGDLEHSYQIQAVYDIFDKYELPHKETMNKVIVIGHNLQNKKIEKKFRGILI